MYKTLKSMQRKYCSFLYASREKNTKDAANQF